MKIKNLLSNLDLSKQQYYQISEYFISELNNSIIEYNINIFESKFKEIWLHAWLGNGGKYENDKIFWEGLRLILLDNIPICTSDKLGKIQDFQWISEECLNLARKHIINISNYSNQIISDIFKKHQNLFIKENYEINDYYSLMSSCQLLNKFHQIGFYKNEKVFVSTCNDVFSLKIIFESGITKIVNILDVKFPICGLKIDLCQNSNGGS